MCFARDWTDAANARREDEARRDEERAREYMVSELSGSCWMGRKGEGLRRERVESSRSSTISKNVNESVYVARPSALRAQSFKELRKKGRVGHHRSSHPKLVVCGFSSVPPKLQAW